MFLHMYVILSTGVYPSMQCSRQGVLCIPECIRAGLGEVVCIPQCNGSGGTHPTGMHPCLETLTKDPQGYGRFIAICTVLIHYCTTEVTVVFKLNI